MTKSVNVKGLTFLFERHISEVQLAQAQHFGRLSIVSRGQGALVEVDGHAATQPVVHERLLTGNETSIYVHFIGAATGKRNHTGDQHQPIEIQSTLAPPKIPKAFPANAEQGLAGARVPVSFRRVPRVAHIHHKCLHLVVSRRPLSCDRSACSTVYPGLK